MAVGGLVLSLSADTPQRLAAERWIQADPRLEQGPREGLRLAVVALTDTLRAGHDLCQELLAQPGIDHLEVAYVAPEEEPPASSLPASGLQASMQGDR